MAHTPTFRKFIRTLQKARRELRLKGTAPLSLVTGLDIREGALSN